MEGERVQAIAAVSNCTNTIPIEFIRTEKEQPGITTLHGHAPDIPVIDIGNPDEERLVESIVEAGCNWGMFQIVNHGIPSDVISKLQEVGREFFELPQQEKEAYAKAAGSPGMEGYGTILQKEEEGRRAWVDHLFNKIWPPSAINYEFWPKNPPSYRF